MYMYVHVPCYMYLLFVIVLQGPAHCICSRWTHWEPDEQMGTLEAQKGLSLSLSLPLPPSLPPFPHFLCLKPQYSMYMYST